MLPDRVSNPGPLTYESDAQPIALHGLAVKLSCLLYINMDMTNMHLLRELFHTHTHTQIKKKNN